jgi:hypothetical protein
VCLHPSSSLQPSLTPRLPQVLSACLVVAAAPAMTAAPVCAVSWAVLALQASAGQRVPRDRAAPTARPEHPDSMPHPPPWSTTTMDSTFCPRACLPLVVHAAVAEGDVWRQVLHLHAPGKRPARRCVSSAMSCAQPCAAAIPGFRAVMRLCSCRVVGRSPPRVSMNGSDCPPFLHLAPRAIVSSVCAQAHEREALQRSSYGRSVCFQAIHNACSLNSS